MKRLAEIVSQQAIAQQEKMEYPEGDEEGANGNGSGGYSGVNGHTLALLEEEASA